MYRAFFLSMLSWVCAGRDFWKWGLRGSHHFCSSPLNLSQGTQMGWGAAKGGETQGDRESWMGRDTGYLHFLPVCRGFPAIGGWRNKWLLICSSPRSILVSKICTPIVWASWQMSLSAKPVWTPWHWEVGRAYPSSLPPYKRLSTFVHSILQNVNVVSILSVWA